ncbi:MAG: DUF1326 domain-containing protein [Chloroflexi bacterium]|nr:DUF1326 domain-containing protein [Chloroflexota bacterium]
MAQQVQWRMKGQYVKNCSCNAGCPCDFNQDPTHGVCEFIVAMNIVEGNYGSVPLGGLRWAVVGKSPGPLHQGNVVMRPFIESKASEKQRQALLAILSGQAGGPWFEIIKSVTSKLEKPQFTPIDFQFDLKKRRARVGVSGAFETLSEPVKNPVTGKEHRAYVSLPEGVEYKMAEIANATINRSDIRGLKFNWPNGHSSLAEIEHTNSGLKAGTARRRSSSA